MTTPPAPPARRRAADTCDTFAFDARRVGRVERRLLPDDTVAALADTFKVLGDPTRVRILDALSADELCVCDIALVLGMSVSALSHQLRFLRERGAVSRRKVGRIAYYRLVDDLVQRLILDAAVHVAEGAV